MSLYEKLINHDEKLALIGLGYVGMPIAVAFAKKNIDVIGFDLNKEKISLYKSGIDPTKEVGDEVIKTTSVEFTADESKLQKAKFLIVAVPTPVNTDHTPDLTPIIGASEIVGRNLTKGAIVVYESTVYPGCTEDVFPSWRKNLVLGVVKTLRLDIARSVSILATMCIVWKIFIKLFLGAIRNL